MPRLPFIENMNENVLGLEAPVLKITENGKYITQNLDKVLVDVKGKGGSSNTRIEGHTLIIER